MDLRSFACVMGRLQPMSMGAMGMMRCRFMMTGVIVPGRFPATLPWLVLMLGSF